MIGREGPDAAKTILFTATVASHIQHFHLPYLQFFFKNGWGVDVACRGGFKSPFIRHSYDLPFSRDPLSFENLKSVAALKKLISAGGYDIIHCHTPVGGALTRLAAVNARRRGTKLIYTAHGFHFYRCAPLRNWFFYYPVEKILSGITDCLITINSEDYFLAKTRFCAGRTDYIHGTGADSARFFPISEQEKRARRAHYGYDAKDFLMIYAGELNKNKNQKFLIETLLLLKKQIPGVRLLLAGEDAGQKENCRRVAEALGVSGCVDFLGCREDPEEWIAMCDLSVSSSLREGLGQGLIEGLLCGLPVLALDNRGHREIAAQSRFVFLTQPGDKAGFAARLFRIYEASSHGAFSKTAIAESAHGFTLYDVLPQMNAIYRKYM